MIGDLLSGPIMDLFGKFLAVRQRKGSKTAFGHYVGTWKRCELFSEIIVVQWNLPRKFSSLWLIVDTNYTDVRNVWMAEEEGLKLRRRYLEAFVLNKFFYSVHNTARYPRRPRHKKTWEENIREISSVVHYSNIAGLEPSVIKSIPCGFLVSPVAFHDRWPF